MKRLRWVLVLLPLLMGVGVILYRTSGTASEGVHRSPLPGGSPGAETAPAPQPTSKKTLAELAVPRGAGGFRITVRSLGKPLANARVEMREINGPGEKSFDTSADGVREILQIPSGAYLVTVRPTRHVPQNHTVHIQADQKTELSVDVQPGAQIRGRVLDASGTPLAGTFITLLDGQTRFPIGSELNTKSGPDGRFLIDGVPVQDLALQFRHLQYKPLERTGLRPRDATDLIEVEAVLQTGGRLSGRVVNPAGLPVAGATVIAYTGYSTPTQTDERGAFSLQGLEEQAMTVRVTSRGLASRTLWVVPPASPPLEIRLETPGAIRIRFSADEALEALRLTVKRYETDLAREMEYLPEVVDRGEGSYALPDLEPGIYRVVLQAPGYESPEIGLVTVVAGHEADAGSIRLKKMLK